MYYIIHNSDGDTTVEQVTREELLERINENYYGADGYISSLKGMDLDTNYWGENVLIIKGEIVTPEPEKVVTQYNID